MSKDYTFTDTEVGFEINNATLVLRVRDMERSSGSNAVNVTVKYEIDTNPNGGFVLEYQEMDYPGESIKPRDFALLEGITDHLNSLGVPVEGVPST